MSEPTTIVLDTPPQIANWVFLSRMHQLALELNTSMRHRMPILYAMYAEGLIDVKLKGTRANKLMVLNAMVLEYKHANPGWEPGATITRALDA